jgi:hypothetical protein
MPKFSQFDPSPFSDQSYALKPVGWRQAEASEFCREFATFVSNQRQNRVLAAVPHLPAIHTTFHFTPARRPSV